MGLCLFCRWSSSSKLHSKNGIENKPHRKNSNPMSNLNFVSTQQVNYGIFKLIDRCFEWIELLTINVSNFNRIDCKSNQNHSILGLRRSKHSNGRLDNPNLIAIIIQHQRAVTNHRLIRTSIAIVIIVPMETVNSTPAWIIKIQIHRYRSEFSQTTLNFPILCDFHLYWLIAASFVPSSFGQ